MQRKVLLYLFVAIIIYENVFVFIKMSNYKWVYQGSKACVTSF